ncbi:MAG: HAD hydrolase-like protein [Lentisphaerae bacterium]|jgi:phosphoglycolate phosphatase|nr:HAD hydrolase-like protein [Lentisphaerota bacterium]MBT4820851.1 HAD hydrolase-like protein [Lentisphaerota bacterium]MBT5611399.1 HAD hydrolase-like protein [Lentisphaerota bacterium]MBT7059627.1 HAD hydrolase-like protein [Lentisphaerota bacterium]MBT7846856.1 HAD hydrolase-like protein [Lentisphaerota bacterium]
MCSVNERCLKYIFEPESVCSVDAVMIGDRRHDIVAAKALGIPSVGVLYGYGSQDELEAAGADLLLESPSDLRRLAAPIATLTA